MTNEQDPRYEKVRKLLNKAERAATEEEAEAFFAKAQELMTKWMLDEAKLQATGKAEQDKLVGRRFKIATTYKHADQALLMGICKANDCQIHGWTGSPDIHVFGFEGDVERVAFLYSHLQMQSARAARKAVQPSWDDSSPYIFKRSFRLGFARAVARRLQLSRQEAQQAAVDEDASLLPVLASRANQVLEEFRRQNPHLRTTRGRGLNGSSAGASAGRAAGERADLGGGRVGTDTRGALGR